MSENGKKKKFFRVLSLFGRFVAAAAFIGFLIPSAFSGWRWISIKAARSQDLSLLEYHVGTGIARKDMSFAERWIRYRPYSESAQIIERLKPFSPGLTPLIFFNMAKRARVLGDVEEKRFWSMVARFRLRYDAVRCGSYDAHESADEVLQIFYHADKSLIDPLSVEDTITLTRKVLEFDAQYPANNTPADTCRFLNNMSAEKSPLDIVPEESWPELRFNLRYATDLSLQLAAERLKKGQ